MLTIFAPSSTYLEPRKSPFQKSLLEWSEQRLLGSSDSVFKVSKGQMGRDYYWGWLHPQRNRAKARFSLSLCFGKPPTLSLSVLQKTNLPLHWHRWKWSEVSIICKTTAIEVLWQPSADSKGHFTRITFAPKSRLRHFDIELCPEWNCFKWAPARQLQCKSPFHWIYGHWSSSLKQIRYTVDRGEHRFV